MTSDEAFGRALVAITPNLRRFAYLLAGGRQQEIDDFVQDAFVKAWAARASFEPGSNLVAWVCTIMRNKVISDRRSAWRKVDWNEEVHPYVGAAERPTGDIIIEAKQVLREIDKLCDDHREVLKLTGIGYSIRDIGEALNLEDGTVKSRQWRARDALLRELEKPRKIPERAIIRPALRALVASLQAA